MDYADWACGPFEKFRCAYFINLNIILKNFRKISANHLSTVSKKKYTTVIDNQFLFEFTIYNLSFKKDIEKRLVC